MTWLPWTISGASLFVAWLFYQRVRELLQSNRTWRQFYFDSSDRWAAKEQHMWERIAELEEKHGGPYR